MSIDVHFRELEPYYKEVTSPFDDLVETENMIEGDNGERLLKVGSIPLLIPGSTSEIPIELPNPKITCDISSPPLEVRRTSCSNAGVPPDHYGFPHDISQFISYSNISATHRAFIASLDSVTLPKCW